MSEETTQEQLTAALAEVAGLNRRIDEARAAGDTARKASAEVGIKETTAEIVELKRKEAEEAAAAQKAAIDEAVKAALSDVRAPSLAAMLGEGGDPQAPSPLIAVHASLKAALGDTSKYKAGEFIRGIFLAGSRDAEEQAAGKALLAKLGINREDIPDQSTNKAILGATSITGGYVLPNNLVDTLVKPAVQEAVYQQLITVRTNVNVRGVDQPYRLTAPAKATFQTWGSAKPNVNETYGTYSAAMGTMAVIIDLGKQYLRFSAGSAEADAIDEIGKAFILGENFEILAGAGTGSASTGDPCTGVYTALAATTPTYTTAHSASSSTVAGSAAFGFTQAFGALATRSRRATAIVTDAVTFWTLYGQGSDNAGFWMSELLGAGFQIQPDGGLRWRGVPIYWDANFNTNTSTTKAAIAAQWDVFKLYRGDDFRIDTSDVAGTRWDNNLVGFRGEEEIAFNASTGVAVGAAQLITGLIP